MSKKKIKEPKLWIETEQGKQLVTLEKAEIMLYDIQGQLFILEAEENELKDKIKKFKKRNKLC